MASIPSSIPEDLKQFIKIKITTCTTNGLEFVIETYSVIPTDVHGKIPKRHSYAVLDDNTYVKYPELIKLVPRGFSVAYYNGVEVCRLDGLEKFDGSCPLDDDNECSSNIFNQNAADIKQWKNLKVEFLEKANGKMAIFKVFQNPTDNTKYLILGGSKNVHVVVGLDEDLGPKMVVKADLHYQILSQFQHDHMHTDPTLLLNKTIIGEYVDGQHIVYTEKPYLVYFSGPTMNIKRLMPDQNYLPTLEQLQEIRSIDNCEGAVVVYTNLDNNLVFRQKHKSVWYILIRVMREGLRHYSKQTETDIILNKVYGIFKKRSNDFLALNEEDFAKWYVVLKNFILFIKQSKYDFPDIDVQKQGIALIYHEFVNTDPTIYLNNDTKSKYEYQEPLEAPYLAGYVHNLYDNGIKVCVIMRGPSGSGKSSTVKKLKNIMNMESFSTDDLFMIDGEYKFDPSKLESMHNRNFQNFKDAVYGQVQGLIVDNTNIAYHEYQKYIELARGNGYVTVVLQCKKLSPETLFARSTHGVPINSLIAKVKKYQFVDPVYCGIFFPKNEIENLLTQFDYVPKQTTPLHITLYYGRDQVRSVECTSVPVSKEYKIKVHSFCTSKAGKFLKVSIEDFEGDNLHVTLETFEGFKPVDVGIYPAETSIDINANIRGIYGPIY
jgi:hypothetical protein